MNIEDYMKTTIFLKAMLDAMTWDEEIVIRCVGTGDMYEFEKRNVKEPDKLVNAVTITNQSLDQALQDMCAPLKRHEDLR